MLIRTPLDLGLVIRERRKELGLDQAELARRIGVSRQWIVEIERGKPRAEVGLILRSLHELRIQLATTTPADASSPLKPEPATKTGRGPKPDLDAVINKARGRRS